MIKISYECDACGCAVWFEMRPTERIIKKRILILDAREHGWTMGKHCLCPRCKKRGRNKNATRSK